MRNATNQEDQTLWNIFGPREPKEIGKRGEELPQKHEGLPDSYRPRGLCPRCGKQSSFENAGSTPVTFDSPVTLDSTGKQERLIIDQATVLICRHCGQGTLVIEEEWIGDVPKKQSKQGGYITYRGIHWWPLPDSNLSADIPGELADVFAEASRCLASECPRASAVMSRRTLEAITTDKGETSGTLAERLAALASKNILHPSLSAWAKEVRLIGNAGAHYDPLNTVSIDDAKDLQSFVRELLKYLYELPAELERRRSTS
jgi:hypothetical protein